MFQDHVTIRNINRHNALHNREGGISDETLALLMIGESLDDYIEHRIETDKVLESILIDIQDSTGKIALRT